MIWFILFAMRNLDLFGHLVIIKSQIEFLSSYHSSPKLSCFHSSSTSALSCQSIACIMSATSGASNSVARFRNKMLGRGRKAGRYLKKAKVPTTFLLDWSLMYPRRDLAIPRESDVHAKAATSHITSTQISGVFIPSRAELPR